MSATRPLSILTLAVLVAVLLATAAPARAVEEGATSASVSLGAGRQLDRTYTVLSGRYGYYFVRDFEASIGVEAWRGNDPAIYKVVPELRWVYSGSPRAGPYVAGFLSRTFYDGLPDRFTYGGRLGFYFTLNRGSSFAVGVVTERISNCDQNTYRKCQQTYPEAGLHFTF
jgi:hypothetical protein